jgi:hypothetical protein
MAFDPEREIEIIEEMKQSLRAQFERSSRNNERSADLDQRNGAARSALAYAELVRAQAELARLGRPKRQNPVL